MIELPGLSPDEWAEQMLLPHHLVMLESDRAIARAAILARRTRSARSGLDLMNLGLTAFPTPGILIPIYPAATLPGQQSIVAYRPDKPPDPKRKYYWPAGQRARIDVPPACRHMLSDPAQTLYVVEGWLKADALASAGLCAIGLLGTSAFGWKPEPGLPILSDWEAIPLNGRLVRVIFDSDTVRKEGVALARMRLTTLLRSRGAIVEWVILPDADGGAKLGADDWLALGHTPEEIKALCAQPGEDPYISAELNDIGNSERFVYANAGRLRWSYEQKIWYSWDGTKWDGKNQERVLGFAHETAREAQIAASRLAPQFPNRDAIVAWTAKLGSSHYLNAMASRSKDALACSSAAFDMDPWLLNAANGTVDLKTGILYSHDPEHMITKIAPASYDPGATLKEWDDFLAETMAGKEGLPDFMQRALGYSITGDTSEERLFMPIGKTRSGKSTLVEAVAATLGEYAATASFDTFLKRQHEGVREDIARLAGARFVSAIEVEEGKHLADAIVKQLTGGDTITARLLYQGSFEFAPQLKLWLVANEEPTVASKNEAMWERILRLPFDHYVPEGERDKGLKGRLKDPTYAGAAILAYLVRGAMRWQAEGLGVPSCVTSATRAYRERMDPLEGWLQDDCTIDEMAVYKVTEAFPAYLLWAKRNGVDRREQLGRNGFKQAMEQRGFTYVQGSDRARYWRGLMPPPVSSETKSGLGSMLG